MLTVFNLKFQISVLRGGLKLRFIDIQNAPLDFIEKNLAN